MAIFARETTFVTSVFFTGWFRPSKIEFTLKGKLEMIVRDKPNISHPINSSSSLPRTPRQCISFLSDDKIYQV